ncbi:alanine racemase [Nocardioides marmoribigeumensis]|uniref:Alanine racemase n=1 Tax=Nocardioides marmoribigeumensis TaxID=433649 RepID=A0ABU2BUJ8_9ACTN|nr:alanine racemase [Nocardioides marmoribigeumensis]MDR7362304.1 alanine racemase [Nocardioides marmoribigeumensis]
MLTLYVDQERWQAHLDSVVATVPGLVPVAKGNGYGFGVPRLAELAQDLGADTLAVGTYAEVPAALEHFGGDVLVLTPWRPFEVRASYSGRLVHTVGRTEDLDGLATASRDTDPDAGGRARVVLELMTSMKRHGFTPAGLRAAADHLAGVTVEGFALHLPMSHGSHLGEVERAITDLVASGIDTRRLYVSHLTDGELAALAASYPDFEVRPRIGTRLWLGDRGALRVKATVLDVHEVERGDVFGYRGRSAPKHGHLLIVSGGTAHGIGLEAPTGGATMRDRAARVAKGGLDAAGFVRSPFTVGGKQRLFAEPPHMQASMLFLPAGAPVPVVGQEVDVQVRFTTTTFDQISLV